MTTLLIAFILVTWPLIVVRILTIGVSLFLWFWTQKLLARRVTTTVTPEAGAHITDGIHDLTTGSNLRLQKSRWRAPALLISSSLVIDLLGLYLLGSSIFGHSFQPFLGLLMVFALRQLCQGLCPLPTPEGMIWKDPGFPTLLVTYGTSNDLFFSGHTAIAVYGAATLAGAFGTSGMILGLAIAVFEITAVLRLRAHYTMDVFTGAVTALYVHRLAIDWAPTVDQWLSAVARLIEH